MSRWPRLAVTTAMALVLAAPAFAQSSTTDSTMNPSAAPPPAPAAPAPSPTTSAPARASSEQSMPATSGGRFAQQQEGQTLASGLIGTTILGADGESVGEVSDLVLDDQNRVVGALLSVGGFLGLGAKTVGVPWQAVSIMQQDGAPVAIVELSKDELAAMSEYRTLADIRAAQARQQAAPATGGGMKTTQ